MSGGQPHARPRVVASQCLGFAAVRYNGAIIESDFVQQLAREVDIIEVCPEVAIGLGVPRDPIRMQRRDERIALVQPSTGRDLTTAMAAFAESFASSLEHVDGIILKARSPSCGTHDVSVFAQHPGRAGEPAVESTAPGRFASVMLENARGAAITDEISVRSFTERDHFLTRIFSTAQLRALGTQPNRASLVAFHSSFKYLLMAYSPELTTQLGRVVAGAGAKVDAAAMAHYAETFARALARPASGGGYVNALMHMFGYVSDGLTPALRASLARAISDAAGSADRRVQATRTLRAIIDEQQVTYLQAQTLFEPYPPYLAGTPRAE